MMSSTMQLSGDVMPHNIPQTIQHSRVAMINHKPTIISGNVQRSPTDALDDSSCTDSFDEECEKKIVIRKVVGSKTTED